MPRLAEGVLSASHAEVLNFVSGPTWELIWSFCSPECPGRGWHPSGMGVWSLSSSKQRGGGGSWADQVIMVLFLFLKPLAERREYKSRWGEAGTTCRLWEGGRTEQPGAEGRQDWLGQCSAATICHVLGPSVPCFPPPARPGNKNISELPSNFPTVPGPLEDAVLSFRTIFGSLLQPCWTSGVFFPIHCPHLSPVQRRALVCAVVTGSQLNQCLFWNKPTPNSNKPWILLFQNLGIQALCLY